jgi:hypothetical protein
VADVVRLAAGVAAADRPLLVRACEHPQLSAGWRDRFRKRLAELDA